MTVKHFQVTIINYDRGIDNTFMIINFIGFMS